MALDRVVRYKTKKPTWRNPEGFRHVGLLSIAPTSISRFTLYIVVRDLSNCLVEWPKKAFGTHHILTRALVLFAAANTRGFGPYFGDYDDMRKNIREKASISLRPKVLFFCADLEAPKFIPKVQGISALRQLC